MARPKHKHAGLAKWLYVERGIKDLAELERLTGIKEKTLERYRSADGWVDLQQAHVDADDTQLQTLDDVAASMTRLLLQKASEYESIPVEMVDEGVLKGLKALVETVKLLKSELQRMAKRDKLLVVHDLTDYTLRQDAENPIDPAVLNQVFEIFGGYSDEVLDG